jgi:hypothetical protein
MKTRLENESYNYGHLIAEYHLTENVMEKARIVHVLRNEYQLPYTELALELYEVERVVYRLNALNKLIPEFQEMALNGDLRRLKAYALSALPTDRQHIMYQQFKEKMHKTKNEEFMRIVAQIAVEQKAMEKPTN